MPGPTLKHAAVSLWLCIGCVETPTLPESGDPPTLTFSPAEADQPWPATRISVQLSGRPLEPSAIWLFEGALSDSKLERLDDGELPKTLTELSRPILSWWSGVPGETLVQPLDWLVPGASYTLAAPGIGRLATFAVGDGAALPSLARLWPPAGARAGGRIVLCGHETPFEHQALELSPGDVLAEIDPGFGTSEALECALVRFDATALQGRVLVLPPEIGGALVEPGAIELGVRGEPLSFPWCSAEEIELGPGCARAEDDRLVVRSADQPLLWRFAPLALGESARLVAAAATAEFVVRGLTPMSTIALSGSVTATDGVEASFSAEVTTTAPRLRLVLSEVLANPVGPEPSSEWVELYNAGTATVSLSGMRLRDSGGSVELPAVEIEAGGFALVVREDFSVGPSDVAPDLRARRVALPQLAKNGLANSGEQLALLDRAGQVLSTFPAIAAPHAGVSIARAHPDARDTDMSAFSEHAAPGASPGAANVARTELED